MNRFISFIGEVIPLNLKNVDTDQIIPARYLTSVSREGYGENLFRNLKDKDPNFVFNLDKYKNASILLADSNFGCGSSREHAVWALCSAGIKVVIAKSFADIFFSNSSKNGLLLITLKEETIDSLFLESESRVISLGVNLENQVVTLQDGKTESFSYDPFRKHCLLKGLDDVDYILSHKEKIKDYLKSSKAIKLPYVD